VPTATTRRNSSDNVIEALYQSNLYSILPTV
jgi:hypothetical protein